MGAIYTRQSTYEDGDTITADHTNNEFDQLLAAFAASTGHTHDGTTGEGGPITSLLGTSLTFGNGTAGTDITVTFDGESNDGVFKWMEDEDYFEFSDDLLIASTEKIQFRDTGLYINSSTDGQLDIVADTEVQIAATTVDINGAVDISGNLSIGGNLDVTGTFDLSDANFTNAGDIQLDSISGDSDTNTNITFSGSDVITFTNGGETQLTFNNGSILPTTNNDVDLGSDALEFKDLYIDGTAYLDAVDITSIAADTTVATDKKIQFRDSGLSINSSADGQLDIIADTEVQIAATTIDINGNVEISGDLTISGDDLTMGTNTAGHILVADGTNFNPTAVGDLSEISSIANDDVFLAVDTSGGGLKKVARSTVVSGLATSAAISNVVEDTSPQLGGNLDTNSQNILIDDAHFIGDENGNEQIIFQTTSSAVNQFDVTNAASGNGPKLSATGSDSNIDLDLLAKGSGIIKVISPGGSGNSGAIQLNCESNSHGQILKSQPHSASATNTMLLPEGASSTLVSLVSTDTLTNKTLTSPKINEDVAVTSTATELNVLDGITAVVGELNALDLGSTAVGTAIASKAVILDSNKDYTGIRNLTITGELDAATLDISGAIDVAGNSVLASVDVTGVATAATFEPDGDTAAGDNAAIGYTAAEGLILTGQGSTSDITLKNDADATVFTVPTGTDDILFPDNAKAMFGAGSDLQIYHNATHSYIDNNTGNIYIRSNVDDDDGGNIVLEAKAGENGIIIADDGDVSLHFNGNLKLATTNTGVAITGDVVASGTVEPAGDTAAGDNAAVGYTAAEGLILTGQGSTNDVTIKNDADADVIEIPTGTTSVTMTGSLKPLTYNETYVSKSAASTVTCDLATANHFAVTLDQATTFAFSNPPSSGTSFAFTLIITQHSTAVALTWPNTVDWAGGSAPDAAGANEVQAYGFITRDGGTTYYGFLGGTAIA